MTTPFPDLMTMLRELIAAPSMSSVSPEFDTDNMAVINLLADWMEGYGFSVEVMPLPAQPNKANLLATIGPVFPECQGLMLAGHTDTVPYDASFWHQDPFKLIEQDSRLYGLGTCDMKSFFALILEAVRGLDVSKFKQPLVILATADEESSMDGAQLLLEKGCPNVRYAVIGEPTGMKPVNAHKGIMMEGIKLVGHGGHSSNPAFGVNAIEAMHKVMGELLQWRNELQQAHHDPRFTVPVPTLNLGHIHGGDNPNRICEKCELHFDLRPLPGMPLENLRSELKDRLAKVLKGSKISWDLFPLFHGTPAMHTDEHSPIVRSCEHLSGEHSHAVAFCTEAPYLNQLGIDTVVLGPGDIDQAHQPDEYLALERVRPTVELLRRLIAEYCL